MNDDSIDTNGFSIDNRKFISCFRKYESDSTIQVYNGNIFYECHYSWDSTNYKLTIHNLLDDLSIKASVYSSSQWPRCNENNINIRDYDVSTEFGGQEIGTTNRNNNIENILSYDYKTIEDSQYKLNNKYTDSHTKNGTFRGTMWDSDFFSTIKKYKNVIHFKPPVVDDDDDDNDVTYQLTISIYDNLYDYLISLQGVTLDYSVFISRDYYFIEMNTDNDTLLSTSEINVGGFYKDDDDSEIWKFSYQLAGRSISAGDQLILKGKYEYWSFERKTLTYTVSGGWMGGSQTITVDYDDTRKLIYNVNYTFTISDNVIPLPEDSMSKAYGIPVQKSANVTYEMNLDLSDQRFTNTDSLNDSIFSHYKDIYKFDNTPKSFTDPFSSDSYNYGQNNNKFAIFTHYSVTKGYPGAYNITPKMTYDMEIKRSNTFVSDDDSYNINVESNTNLYIIDKYGYILENHILNGNFETYDNNDYFNTKTTQFKVIDPINPDIINNFNVYASLYLLPKLVFIYDIYYTDDFNGDVDISVVQNYSNSTQYLKNVQELEVDNTKNHIIKVKSGYSNFSSSHIYNIYKERTVEIRNIYDKTLAIFTLNKNYPGRTYDDFGIPTAVITYSELEFKEDIDTRLLNDNNNSLYISNKKYLAQDKINIKNIDNLSRWNTRSIEFNPGIKNCSVEFKVSNHKLGHFYIGSFRLKELDNFNKINYESTEFEINNIKNELKHSIFFDTNSSNDQTGNATVTLHGNPTVNSDGLNLNGNDQYASLGSTTLGPSISFAAWYKMESSNSYQRIYDFGKSSNNRNIILAQYSNYNQLFADFYHSNGNKRLYTNFNGDFKDNFFNNWYFAVHTIQTINNISYSKLYINGIYCNKNETNKDGRFTNYHTNEIRVNSYIGKSNWSNDPYFHGKIKSLNVWNRALTEFEIMYLYTKGKDYNVFNDNNPGTILPLSYKNPFINTFEPTDKEVDTEWDLVIDLPKNNHVSNPWSGPVLSNDTFIGSNDAEYSFTSIHAYEVKLEIKGMYSSFDFNECIWSNFNILSINKI